MSERKKRRLIKENGSVQLFITEFMAEAEKFPKIKLELADEDANKIKLEFEDKNLS